MKAKSIKILGGIALGVALVVLALPTILHKAGLHPEYNGEAVQLPAGKRALIIATTVSYTHLTLPTIYSV